jgi:O-antigen ligase
MNSLIKIKFKDKLFISLILIMPIALIIGPAIFNLISALISIFFLFFYKNKIILKKILKTKLIFFLFFYFYLILSSSLSNDPLLSFHSSLFYIRYILVALSVYFFLIYFENYLKYMFIILLLIFVFFSLDGVYFILNKISFFGIEQSQVRFRSFQFDYILGSYVARMLPIILVVNLVLFRNKREKFELFLLFFVISSLFIIFISGERAALIHYLIFIILLLLGLSFTRKFYYLLFSQLFLLNLFIYFAKPETISRFYYFTLSQIGVYDEISKSFSFKLYDLNLISPAHESLIKVAFYIFKENIFFGSGPRMFRELCNDYLHLIPNGCNTHPHNFYVQLLSETGIFGFLFLLVGLIYVTYLILKKIIDKYFYFYKSNISESNYIILCGLFCYIFPINANGNFFNGWISIILYITIGFFFYFNNLNLVNDNNK